VVADGGECLPEDGRTEGGEGASERFRRGGGGEESPSRDGADGGLKKHCYVRGLMDKDEMK